MVKITTTKSLTAAQGRSLDIIWGDCVSLIASAVHKSGIPSHAIDDIVDDAILRTITSIANSGEHNLERIKSRARSCAMDACKSAARRHVSESAALAAYAARNPERIAIAS